MLGLALSLSLALAGTPPLGAAAPLPGDATIGPSAGTQDQPALLEGDGTSWLVVWRDGRGTLAGTQGSSASDVWGVRVDADGVPLDPVAFPIASGPWAEGEPRGAWNGDGWLVAFEADAATPGYFGTGVRARRVAADGTPDPAEVVLADDPDVDEQLWDVASDAVGWAVLWQTVDGALGSYVTDGAVVGADGGLDSVGRVYTPSPGPGAPVNLRLAHGQGRYLATFAAWGDDDDVLALPLDAALSPLGPVVGVVDDAHSSVFPSVAAGPDGFYVTWFDDTFGANWTEVRGTPVDADGRPSLVGGAVLSGTSWPIDVRPDVASTGAGFGVAWELGSTAIHTSLVDPAGALQQSFPVSTPGDTVRRPTVAAAPDGLLVGWSNQDRDIELTTVTSGGALGPVEPVSLAAPAQTSPAIAGGPGGYLLVSESWTADGVRLLAWRTDAAGGPLGGPTELARGTALADPAVAWNGSRWLVVWTDLDPTTPANGVVGVRVSAGGAVLDPSPLAFLTGESPAVGASTSGDFLVTGVVPDTFNTNRLRAVRVSPAGVVRDAVPLVLGTNFATTPDVAPLGAGWVVTWGRRFSNLDPRSVVSYTVVAQNGAVTAEARVRTSGGTDHEVEPAVASDGVGALIVWSDDGDLRGRRLDGSGALLGAGAGFVVSAQANRQFAPELAWNGHDYAVGWTDYRRHPGLEPGEGDVYTTTVSANGRVGDLAGRPAAAGLAPESDVVVAGAEGRSVWAWTRMNEEAPFGAFRLEVASSVSVPSLEVVGTPSPGGRVDLVASAGPGETVHFAVAPGAGGVGPCHPLLPAACLDLGLGAMDLGAVVADPDGYATLTVGVPGVVQPGATFTAQAWIGRGADSVASPTVAVLVVP